jgi:isoquinoline 1-oxidoreductase beta subunit
MGLERRLNVAKFPGVPRRTFLKVGAAGGGLLLGFSLSVRVNAAPTVGDATQEEFAPDGFVRIDREGRVTLVMPQVEMGQGTYTSMSMLIAEELEVNLERVTLEAAPPDDRLYVNVLIGSQVTGGSTSVRTMWKPLRRAGAAARPDHSRRASLARGPHDLSCRKRRGDSPTDGSAAHLRSARRLGGEAAGAG